MAHKTKKKWLTITQAATEVGMDRQKILRDVKAGKIQSRRVGWIWLVDLTSLNEYAESL